MTVTAAGCISIAALTSAGDRAENQDSHVIVCRDESHLFAIVADGLGGHEGGAVASSIATATLAQELRSCDIATLDFNALFARANDAIVAAGQSTARLRHMRTTVVLLHLDLTRNTAHWMHCGDSRLLFLCNGQIAHRTKDHSVAQLLVADGEVTIENLRFHPDRHKLTRSMGGRGDESRPRIASAAVALTRPCSILLCSDGWWELLAESEILDADVKYADTWLERMQRLVQQRMAPGADNYTAITVAIN